MSELVLVTGYYRASSRASFTEYLRRIGLLLGALRGNLVFFTDLDMIETLRSKVPDRDDSSSLRVIFIPYPESEWQSTTRFPTAFWEDQHARNHEAYHHSPRLYKIWYEKKVMVRRALDMKYFSAGSDARYLWIDAGCVRTPEAARLMYQLSINAAEYLEPDRMLLLEVFPLQHTDRASAAVGNLLDITRDNRIGATIFGGGRAAWRSWDVRYDVTMKRMIAQGLFVGKEQNVMTNVALAFPRDVLTVRTPQEREVWFHFQQYLSRRFGHTVPQRAVGFSRLGHYGRMGNQLFQIACVLGVSRATNRTAILPTSWKHALLFPRYAMHAREATTLPRNVVSVQEAGHDAYTCRLSEHFLGGGAAAPRADDGTAVSAFPVAAFTGPRHIDILGYRQSDRYWAPHATSLVRDVFSVDALRCTNVRNLCATQGLKIDSCIAVHVRRGDYVKLEHIFGVCTTEYYRCAVAHVLADSVERPTQVLFVSDDLDYCRKTFGGTLLPGGTFFSPCTSEEDDWLLLRLAKHRVLSNSSFSWWAAYLADADMGITVAPSPWIKTMPCRDIYQKSWKILMGETGLERC